MLRSSPVSYFAMLPSDQERVLNDVQCHDHEPPHIHAVRGWNREKGKDNRVKESKETTKKTNRKGAGPFNALLSSLSLLPHRSLPLSLSPSVYHKGKQLHILRSENNVRPSYSLPCVFLFSFLLFCLSCSVCGRVSFPVLGELTAAYSTRDHTHTHTQTHSTGRVSATPKQKQKKDSKLSFNNRKAIQSPCLVLFSSFILACLQKQRGGRLSLLLLSL